MVDTTTAKDLAEKIEWVGFSCLSRAEHKMVGDSLIEVSSHLPRLLALALWKYYCTDVPWGLKTRSSEDSHESFLRRSKGRKFIQTIMADSGFESA